MKRRAFVFGNALLLAAYPAFAQQSGKMWRIGFCYFGSQQGATETGRYPAFLQGMRDAGYVQGRNLVIEARYADGRNEGIPALIDELLRSKADVIVSTSTPMHRLMQKATSTVPIVITVSPDPVKEGLVASLARPGGNITGLASSNAELSRKYLEVMSDAMPSLSSVHVLYTTSNSTHQAQLGNVRAAGAKAGIEIQATNVPKPQDLDAALAELARSRPQGVLVLTDGVFVEKAHALAQFALKHRLPTMFTVSEFPEAGGLMSYGPDIRDNYRRAAFYVDRILKGARPADLPIEQPSTFELVINLKTANAIGLQMPKAILFRANRVIQ